MLHSCVEVRSLLAVCAMEADQNRWATVLSEYRYLKGKLRVDAEQLLSCDVITEDELRELGKKESPKKADHLIRRILLNQHYSKPFSHFQIYLKQTGQGEIADKLDQAGFSNADESTSPAQHQPSNDQETTEERISDRQRRHKKLSAGDVLSLKLPDLRQWCSRLNITGQFSSVSQYRESLLDHLRDQAGSLSSEPGLDDPYRQDYRQVWKASLTSIEEKKRTFVQICRNIDKEKDAFGSALKTFRLPEMKFWLGPEKRQQRMKEMETKKPCLLVAGSTSAGKSTLINALLGEDVLPTSHSVATSCLCEIHFSASQKYAMVDIERGGERKKERMGLETKEERQRFAELMNKSSECGDTCEHCIVFWPSEFLKAVEVVDSPGVTEKHGFSLARQITEKFQQKLASGFIYVLDARRSAEEAAHVGGLLSQIGYNSPAASAGAIFVLNKWDVFIERHPQEEHQTEYLKLVEGQIQSMLKSFRPSQLIKMNARRALRLQHLGEISDDLRNLWKSIAGVLPISLGSCLLKFLDPVDLEVESICRLLQRNEREATLSESIRQDRKEHHKKVLRSFKESIKSGRLAEMTRNTEKKLLNLANSLSEYLQSSKGLTFALETPLKPNDNPDAVVEDRFFHTVRSLPKLEKFFKWIDKTLDPFIHRVVGELQLFEASLEGYQKCEEHQEIARFDAFLAKFSYGVSVAAFKTSRATKIVRNFFSSPQMLRRKKAIALTVETKYWEKVQLVCKEDGTLYKHISDAVKDSRPTVKALLEKIPNLIANAENELLLPKLNSDDMAIASTVLSKFTVLRETCAEFRLKLCTHQHDVIKTANEGGSFQTVIPSGFRCEERNGSHGCADIVKEIKFLKNLRGDSLLVFAGSFLIKEDDPLTLGLLFEKHGQSLADRIEQGQEKVITTTEGCTRIKKILLQVLRGMNFLHSKGWAHYHLTPENIWVAESAAVKLGGLGQPEYVDKITSDNKRNPYFQRKIYLAPEIKNGRMGPHCDVYSFGIVLWELLNCKRAEEGMSHFPFPEENESVMKTTQHLKKVFKNCIIQCHEERPEVEKVIQMLDGFL